MLGCCNVFCPIAQEWLGIGSSNCGFVRRPISEQVVDCFLSTSFPRLVHERVGCSQKGFGPCSHRSGIIPLIHTEVFFYTGIDSSYAHFCVWKRRSEQSDVMYVGTPNRQARRDSCCLGKHRSFRSHFPAICWIFPSRFATQRCLSHANRRTIEEQFPTKY